MSKTSGRKLAEKLSDTIVNTTKYQIDHAKVNRTTKGRIVESLGENRYKIMVNGGEYTVKSHWTHNINDVVVIIVCNNDWGQLYVLY